MNLHSKLYQQKAAFTYTGDLDDGSFANQGANKELSLLRTEDDHFSDDKMPRPNRSSTNREYTSMVKEITEKDYEKVLTDQTTKQCPTDDMLTPRREKRSIKDDRTTERKSVKKNEGLMVGVHQAERSLSHRLM